MVNKPNLKILENITEEEIQIDLDLVIQTLLNEMKIYLDLDPYYHNFEFIINRSKTFEKLESKDIFNIGVNRNIQNDKIIIELNKNYIKFLPFILLREIYNVFIHPEISSHEKIQLVINQIIMKDLNSYNFFNEWKILIRENLKQWDILSVGYNRLATFDRLESFFDLQGNINPIKFFFYYLRRNPSLVNDSVVDIHDVFFDEFKKFISKSMNNEDIIETIRCLIFLFYKLNTYRDLLSYKHYFQEFKKQRLLITELTLRKFVRSMNWIKRFSFIAPSYYINWNTINTCILTVFIRFHPNLNKIKIDNIIKNIPFLIAPKITRNSFTLDLCSYLIIPKIYLDDFKKFVKKLENHDYILKFQCLLIKAANQYVNLNYFSQYFQKKRIIDPSSSRYKKKYEIRLKVNYGSKIYSPELTLFDFLLIDRIRFYSVSGFGFERRADTLQTLKSDLINEISSERAKIKQLKNNLTIFYNSDELKALSLKIIEENKKFGFFYLKRLLEEYLTVINFMNKFISKNPDIKNYLQFQDSIKDQFYIYSLNEQLILKKSLNKSFIQKNIISKYFTSKEDYYKNIETITNLHNLINSCYNLKLFSLRSIKRLITDHRLVGNIFKKKEEKLRESYEKYKLYSITTHEIDNILDKFLTHKPPIIQPCLINTLLTTNYENDLLVLILTDTVDVQNKLKSITKFFPNFVKSETVDLISQKKFFYIQISTPFLTNKEKHNFYSIIYNNFKDNILYGKSFLYSGFYPAFSIKNYYDFEKNEFFYTGDLFTQYFLYIKKILGEEKKSISSKTNKLQEKFWLTDKSFQKFVEKVNDFTSRKNYDFNLNHLNKLLTTHLKLKKILRDPEKFKEIKKEFYFKNYVKSIKFIPAFKDFGFSQYFFYLYPTDMNEVDLKLLLINTFLKINYSACIDDSNALFIKNIMPHNTPNLKYLNWLTRAKKIIREYCLFFIKKIYQICHFNYNLNSKGWVYEKDRFKIYMQNILFNPNYNIEIPEVKEFNIEKKSVSKYFGPNSPEYQSLTQIFNWKSIDIKSYLASQKYSIINHITSLLKKDLIFPYLNLKNLGLHNKINIILPCVKPDLNKKLIKIFSFFNYAFVYEIEGEYFTYGFPEEVKFENGLMIKLYFPKCELHEFINLFDLLFKYLDIKDYLILNDLVDGSQLLKSIYGSLGFLKEYNPLKNLIWNPKDKQWMNHKLFTQKFEPLYPDLLPMENS